VNGSESVADFVSAYEALRAQATGEIPAITPRGLSLFLGSGLPTWMKTWAAIAPPKHHIPVRTEAPISAAPTGDLIRVLTEMALGCERALTI
jgi:hypothetical protein